LIVDVRSPERFDERHVKGAINVPEAPDSSTLIKEKAKADRADLIVLYCSCPSDSGSRRVLERLRATGIENAFVLRGGLAAWMIAGGDVVQR
jgi:rhodanese-related sulfurtransferase